MDGTPQHALIVFRRMESVMFTLENADYFVLKGQQLGIRALRYVDNEVFAIILNFRESQLTLRPKMPHSTGYERAKQHCFNFDCDYIQQFRQNPHDNVCNAPPMSPTWQRYFYNSIDILFFQSARATFALLGSASYTCRQAF